MNQFRVRSANSAEDDAHFIVAAWDSTLPYLDSIGAGEMWGTQPFSHREGFQQDIVDIIRKSEEDDSSDSRRLLVAETEDSANDKSKLVRVGAAMIRDALPYYLLERPELGSKIKRTTSLLFIEVLISDHRYQSQRRGVGAAMVEAIKSRALKTCKDAIYVDAWAGNGRKLNRYYESLGFSFVGDFSLGRRDGSTWPGTLYYMDLGTSDVSH